MTEILLSAKTTNFIENINQKNVAESSINILVNQCQVFQVQIWMTLMMKSSKCVIVLDKCRILQSFK